MAWVAVAHRAFQASGFDLNQPQLWQTEEDRRSLSVCVCLSYHTIFFKQMKTTPSEFVIAFAILIIHPQEILPRKP